MTSIPFSAGRTMTRSGIEGTAGGIGVLGVGLESKHVPGAEGTGGSECGPTSAGWVKEAGIPIDTHLEEVLKSDDGFFVGMNFSACWGNDRVSFGSDDLSVTSPAKERRLINSAWSSRRVWSDTLIFTSLPNQWIVIELEVIKVFERRQSSGIVLRREPK